MFLYVGMWVWVGKTGVWVRVQVGGSMFACEWVGVGGWGGVDIYVCVRAYYGV